MKLPAADRAIVDPAKVRDYLLSSEHPVGRSKALTLAQTNDATPSQANAFGQKYIVRGSLIGPNARSADIVTVWIVLLQEPGPRFVTAYPEAT
ncbi:MAG: adhesin [Acidobacteria bacterium]|nr:adhesin [Acidobacteriota bacterium]